MADKTLTTSRRAFLKLAGIAGFSSVLNTDPLLGFLSEALNLPKEDLLVSSYTCELFRPDDLLQLQYFFYNARVKGQYLIPKDEKYPLFVYIKLPPQHVAEELLVEPLTKREDFKKKNAFVAENSMLGFVLRNKRIKIQVADLLNWVDHFRLVTLDDFATNKGHLKNGYERALKVIDTEFNLLQKGDISNLKTFHQNKDCKLKWPLTKFEVPYKLFLSPIADRDANEIDDATQNRYSGEHIFEGDNLLVKEFSEGKTGIEILRPWENSLIFQRGNEQLPPRFKVVHWIEQSERDSDSCSRLLPAPVHRQELKGLTLMPEYNRDVVSDLFRISALGATTNLKYKHDDPTSLFSLVAWEQKLKYARDNYVSVTYRAIDSFTGIKLLVSILTDRKYKFGVSYLPELYYVAYAEPEKVYEQPIVVSSVPFTKIVPKTKGTYFKPQRINDRTDAYLVASNECVDKITGVITDPSKLLTFDYTGVDKEGNVHQFQSRIIFIPAETYQITRGTYHYNPPNDSDRYTYDSSAGKIDVAINHIGLLNPTRMRGYSGIKNTNSDCGIQDDYEFVITKVFEKSVAQKVALTGTLENIQAHVMHLENEAHYQFDVTSEITYAKLDGLKADTQTIDRIRNDAKNATFHTRGILMLVEMNDELYSDILDNRDNYLSENPLRTVLQYAHITIPQIDRMAGKSFYVRVEFAKAYLDSRMEMDDDFLANKVKLLFKLVNPLNGFFTDNYRSAGAMVDPGIDISYISVLEQTVAYNDTHNEEASALFLTAGDKRTAVPARSIFGNLKAEILGMPLTQIMQEFLPVEDLPIFNYLQQGEDAVVRITALTEQLKKQTDQWAREYDRLKNSLSAEREKFRNLDKEIKRILESSAQAWIDSMMEQVELKVRCSALKAFTNDLENVKKYYVVITTIVDKIKTKYTNLQQILDKLDHIVKLEYTNPGETVITDIIQLLNIIVADKISPSDLTELVKHYLIKKSLEKEQICRIMRVVQDLTALKETLDQKYAAYLNAFNTGWQEASLFVAEFVEQQLQMLQRQVEAQIANITDETYAALGKKIQPIFRVIEKIIILTKAYEHYSRAYADLKKGHYETLATELGITVNFNQWYKTFADNLLKYMNSAIDVVKYGEFEANRTKKLKDLVQGQITKIIEDSNGSAQVVLESYEAQIVGDFKPVLEEATKYVKDLLPRMDKLYLEKAKELYDVQEKIKVYEQKVQNFVKEKIEIVEKHINVSLEKLKSEARGTPSYKRLVNTINEGNVLLRKIREISKQRMEYKYSTNKFKKTSLGGVIDFVPKNTSLSVEVVYEVKFDISAFDRPPSVARQSFKTESTLRNFKIGLIQLLFIDFERVQFVSGSDIKDDFRVAIRDVQFAGSLSFVQVFQEYLKNISDNLVFDIDAHGARIGYSFAIPDISAGYFNFFNLSLSALLTLPFNPKAALQLSFGIGSPYNKFGLTVSGIFGGQGYFNVLAEPRRGIVGMEVCMEFGAIFNINLTVARGTAYLVGGIYIRRYSENFEIRGYILCVGRFNILGLFSASISFYMALECNSHVLVGRCTVKVTKRFSRFFKVSVRCTMEKTIKGAKSQGKSAGIEEGHGLNSDEIKMLSDNKIAIQDTNMGNRLYYGDEELYMTFLCTSVENIKAEISIPDGGKADVRKLNLTVAEDLAHSDKLVTLRINLNKLKQSGDYRLEIKKGETAMFSKTFQVSAGDALRCTATGKLNTDMDSKEYYGSYYYANDEK